MGGVHEDGAVVAVVVVQQGREGLVQAHVAPHVAVAGRRRGHAQRHPAVGSVAHRAVLAAHAVGATAEAVVRHGTDDQGQLQDQLLAAGNVHVDLDRQREEAVLGGVNCSGVSGIAVSTLMSLALRPETYIYV